MFHSNVVRGSILAILCASVGCAAGDVESHDDATADQAELTSAKRGYRKIALTQLQSRALSACKTAEAKEPDGVFYCPKIERFKFQGPITDEKLAAFADARHSDVAQASATPLEAVQTLYKRVLPQLEQVQDPHVRIELGQSVREIEGALISTPNTRLVLARGYWQQSVNSDSIYVVDDNARTVVVFEHGDTDG